MGNTKKVLIGLILSSILIAVFVDNTNLIMRIITGNNPEDLYIGENIDDWKQIELQKPSNSNNVLLFESSKITISIGYDGFIEYKNMEKRFTINDNDLQTIEEAFLMQKYDVLINANDDVLSDLLSKSKVFVFDKVKTIYLTSIKMHYVNVISCPVCGYGSIDFYFMDGTMLFQGLHGNIK